MEKKQEALTLAQAVRETQFINVENGEYLNSAVPCLPNGIIDKTYTGIGGTSLELDCHRDSIVVVPYNNIARAKSSKFSFTNGYKVHWYKKSTKGFKISAFKRYLDEIKKNGNPMKIICVNDQLVHLKHELQELKYDFNASFLLFDEIDSMQEQSAFRSVMDACMDVYLAHPNEMRAMITATIGDFTHPDLQFEKKSKVICESKPLPKLDLVHTGKGQEEVVLQTLRIIETTKEKVVIAFNHLKMACEIADTISKKRPDISVGILCSTNSKKVAKGFYDTLRDDGMLPCTVNIITAAYFNGCDINEKYHSLIYASIEKASLQLSPNTIFQIVGRGRQGLLSSRLILNCGERHDNYKFYTEAELVKLGLDGANIQNGLNIMVKNVGPLAEPMMRAVHGILVEGIQGFPRVFRKSDEINFDISYFKIDQRLNEQATVRLLESIDTYGVELTRSFDLSSSEPLANETSVDIAQMDKAEMLNSFLKDISELLTPEKLEASHIKAYATQYSSLGYNEIDIIIKLLNMTVERGWSQLDLLHQLEYALQGKRKLQMLKQIYFKALWFSFKDDKRLKTKLAKHVAFNEAYSLSEMSEREKIVADLVDSSKMFAAVKYADFRAILKSNPTVLRSIIFNCKQGRLRSGKKDSRTITITGLIYNDHPFIQ